MSRQRDPNCINPLQCVISENNLKIVDEDGNFSWKRHLKRRGWVIINKNNFPLDLPVREWTNQMRDWITTFGLSSSIRGDLEEEEESDEESWTMWEQSDIPGSNKKSGYVSINGGHTNFMWDARLRVKPLFNDMWQVGKTEENYDLVTSFEGFTYCVQQPNESRRCLSFLHPEGLDEMICIRSFISLGDTSQKESGGIILVDGSHREYSKYINTTDRPGKVLVSLWRDEPRRFIRPALHPGDILLFDTKLVTDTFAPSTYRFPFMGMWVTMLPDNPISSADRDARIQWFMTKKETTSWCYGSLLSIVWDTDTYGFQAGKNDNNGNLVVGGTTVSKVTYSDAHARLVVGTSYASLQQKYQAILDENRIKPSQSSQSPQRSSRQSSSRQRSNRPNRIK